MATGTRRGQGIKNRNISSSAGIRPYKMDLVYASETAFLAAKDDGGINSGSAEEGDFFFDSTTNSLKMHDGTNWVEYLSNSSLSGDVSVTAAGATTVTDLTMTGEATNEILEFDGSNWVSVAVSGDLTQTGGAFTIADSVLEGSNVANTADDNVIGGIPVLHRIDTAGGATANTDVTLTHKTRLLDAWVVLKGTGTTSDTLQILNGASAITDAMDISGADTSVVRAGTINDANHEIAAAGTLRVTETDGGGTDSPACSVYVLGLRVA